MRQPREIELDEGMASGRRTEESWERARGGAARDGDNDVKNASRRVVETPLTKYVP